MNTVRCGLADLGWVGSVVPDGLPNLGSGGHYGPIGLLFEASAAIFPTVNPFPLPNEQRSQEQAAKQFADNQRQQ